MIKNNRNNSLRRYKYLQRSIVHRHEIKNDRKSNLCALKTIKQY